MLDPRSFSYLEVAVRDRIAFAMRNRPGDGNRYTRAEASEYPRFLRDADADPDVLVMVVTGAGDEWFCAGEIGRETEAEHEGAVGSGMNPAPSAPCRPELTPGATLRALLGESDVMAPLRVTKPVITALNGSVVGAALTGVLASDVVVAEPHVRLRDTHASEGLVAATGSLLWPMSTGILRAKRWLLTGDWIEAGEAERIGIVTEVVGPGQSLDRAVEFAEHFSALRPEELWLTKRAINNWMIAHVPDVFAPAFAAEVALIARDDAAGR